jgi:hypothetical protein
VVAEYERLHEQFGFVFVDAERPIYEQHRFIRETYAERWTGAPVLSAIEPVLSPSIAG